MMWRVGAPCRGERRGGQRECQRPRNARAQAAFRTRTESWKSHGHATAYNTIAAEAVGTRAVRHAPKHTHPPTYIHTHTCAHLAGTRTDASGSVAWPMLMCSSACSCAWGGWQMEAGIAGTSVQLYLLGVWGCPNPPHCWTEAGRGPLGGRGRKQAGYGAGQGHGQGKKSGPCASRSDGAASQSPLTPCGHTRV